MIEVRTNQRACFRDGAVTDVVEVVIGGVMFMTACNTKEQAMQLALHIGNVLMQASSVRVVPS